MIGLRETIYYEMDGAVDWLKSIVRTVCMYTEKRYHQETIIHVQSIAAKRAQKLYYRKLGIRFAGGEIYNG